MPEKKYTRTVAVNMVIANMIGTGIFTSLGFQVLDTGIPDAFAIMLIWIIGGIIALCGATVYGEVATTINKSGGEYAFLTEIYHPILGFISGWISIIVGFSAAIAGLALAAGEYFIPLLGYTDTSVVLGIPITKLIGVLAIILVSLVHLRGIKFGGQFQNYMTWLKLVLIVAFLIVPFIFIGNYEASNVSFAPTDSSWDIIYSGAFAGALVWVYFAYSGWNASTYIVNSLENPKRNLPYSLLLGTAIVTVIYVLLNFVFLYVATFDELALKPDLGYVVAKKVLGPEIGLIFSAVFSIALISGLSAMFIAAPRVVQVMGKDYAIFKWLGQENKGGAPVLAVVTITILSIVLVIFSSFKDIIEYVGITLAIFSLLTVIGVFILRVRVKDSDTRVKAFWYPITPIVFISFTVWMIYYFVSTEPMKIVYALATITPAILIYFVSKKIK